MKNVSGDPQTRSIGTIWLLILLLTLLLGLSPLSGRAQQWEVQGGWSMIDYDPPRSVVFSVEHLPSAGRLLVRRQMADGRYFLEGGIMYGRETSSDAESWTRSWALSGGRAFRSSMGRLVLGARPSLGVGTLRWSYDSSWFSDRDRRWVYSLDAELEVGVVRPLGIPAVVALTAGIGRVGPLRPETCQDCSNILRNSALPRRSIGLLVYPAGN